MTKAIITALILAQAISLFIGFLNTKHTEVFVKTSIDNVNVIN